MGRNHRLGPVKPFVHLHHLSQSSAGVTAGGVLDYRTFSRVWPAPGRCDICGKGKTVYRSKEEQTDVGERCYARLVREWNAKVGVR